MGYRSDVTICCEEEAYKIFQELIENGGSTEYQPNVRKANNLYLIEYEWVKWDYFTDEHKILCSLNEKSEEGYAYKMIEIGEDNRTETTGNERGYEVFEEMCEEVILHLPEEYEAVSVHLPEDFSENNWIPCDKKLPDETGWYLVSREDGVVNTSFWFEEKTWKEGHNGKILAWQPLPDAYCV